MSFTAETVLLSVADTEDMQASPARPLDDDRFAPSPRCAEILNVLNVLLDAEPGLSPAT